VLCLNVLVCWLIWVVVAVVTFVVINVLKLVITTVCVLVTIALALVLAALLLAAIIAVVAILVAGLLPILALALLALLIYLALRVPLILQALFNWFCELLGICQGQWLAPVSSRIVPLPASQWSPQLKEFRHVDASGNPTRRPILCCDGGGVRGILTLHALKQLEIVLDANCIDIFDMFAGTSTGAIIAACLASGVPLGAVMALYRAKYTFMFTPSLISAIVGGIPGLNQLFVPRYDNSPNKCLLKSIFGDHTLADCKKDIFITAKDTVRSETTYLTAFHNPNKVGDVRGTYQTVKTWVAVAASSSSAPTYFESIGRFIDGGVGAYDNTAYVAAVEALRYSGTPLPIGYVDASGGSLTVSSSPPSIYPVIEPGPDVLYKRHEVLVLSFGTGTALNTMQVGDAQKITTSIGWIHWLLQEGMEDANDQQTYVAKNELASDERAIKFRRYQLDLTDATVLELKAIDSTFTLPEPNDLTTLGKTIGLDAVWDFDFLDQLGHAYGLWLTKENLFNPPFFPVTDSELGDPKVTMQPTYNIPKVYGPQVINELNSQTAP
jgi:hypothetical protein